MVNVEQIEKIIRCVLASGKLEEEKPLSAIIIAPPEVGKTSVIRKYCLKTEGVFYTTDATAFGIIRDTNGLKDFEEGKYTHIVIPDLMTCLGRKRDTVNTFISFMNSLIEEGVVSISTYATKLSPESSAEVKAGFITAIPRDVFSDSRHNWTRMGFLSRALPITFDYAPSTRVAVLNHITEQHYLKESVEALKLPTTKSNICLPQELAKQIIPYATVLAAAQKVYGFRHLRQLQILAKAIALLDGKDSVEEAHIEELGRLCDHINLEFKNI